MPPAISFLVLSLEILVLAGCLLGWIQVIRRRVGGQPVYPYQPRFPVPWGLMDIGAVALAALTAMVLGVTAVAILLGINVSGGLSGISPAEQATLMLTDSTILFIVSVSTLFYLRWRVRAGLHDLGVNRDRFDSDIGLGMQAFAMLAVPVFLLQLTLLKLFPEQNVHPLIKMLQADSSTTLLMVAVFVAVVVAPIVEEIFFRVMLQGWLENVANRIGGMHAYVFGPAETAEAALVVPDNQVSADDDWAIDAKLADAEDVSGDPQETPSTVWPDGTESADPTAVNPYQSPKPVTAAPEIVAKEVVGKMRPRYWPIFVSAALFALVHLGHGWAPVPLFVLAIGLGYLYQQTHRVVPCIVVHLLLNATSMFALWLTITYGDKS